MSIGARPRIIKKIKSLPRIACQMSLNRTRLKHFASWFPESPSWVFLPLYFDFWFDTVFVWSGGLEFSTSEIGFCPVSETSLSFAYRGRNLIEIVTERLVVLTKARRLREWIQEFGLRGVQLRTTNLVRRRYCDTHLNYETNIVDMLYYKLGIFL